MLAGTVSILLVCSRNWYSHTISLQTPTINCVSFSPPSKLLSSLHYPLVPRHHVQPLQELTRQYRTSTENSLQPTQTSLQSTASSCHSTTTTASAVGLSRRPPLSHLPSYSPPRTTSRHRQTTHEPPTLLRLPFSRLVPPSCYPRETSPRLHSRREASTRARGSTTQTAHQTRWDRERRGSGRTGTEEEARQSSRRGTGER